MVACVAPVCLWISACLLWLRSADKIDDCIAKSGTRLLTVKRGWLWSGWTDVRGRLLFQHRRCFSSKMSLHHHIVFDRRCRIQDNNCEWAAGAVSRVCESHLEGVEAWSFATCRKDSQVDHAARWLLVFHEHREPSWSGPLASRSIQQRMYNLLWNDGHYTDYWFLGDCLWRRRWRFLRSCHHPHFQEAPRMRICSRSAKGHCLSTSRDRGSTLELLLHPLKSMSGLWIDTQQLIHDIVDQSIAHHFW